MYYIEHSKSREQTVWIQTRWLIMPHLVLHCLQIQLFFVLGAFSVIKIVTMVHFPKQKVVQMG